MRIANMSEVVYPKTSYKIVGVMFRVHNELGRFCNERQYADAMEKEFKLANIQYEREKELSESFVGERKGRNIADFIIENKIAIEIKAKRFMSREEYYQVRRYLKSGDLKLGILVNFRETYLRPKRILNSSFSNSQFAD